MPDPTVTASEELQENAALGTITISLTTPATNPGIIIGVACPAGITVSSVTFNGSATGWVLCPNTAQTVDAVHIEEWKCVAPAPSTTANIVVTFSASTAYRVIVARAVQDADQTDLIGDSDSAQGTSATAATPTLAVPDAGSLLLDFMVLEDPEVPDSHAAQTDDEEGTWEDDIFHYAASHKTASADTTMSWTFGSDTWAIAAVVVKPAAGGGGGASDGLPKAGPFSQPLVGGLL